MYKIVNHYLSLGLYKLTEKVQVVHTAFLGVYKL